MVGRFDEIVFSAAVVVVVVVVVVVEVNGVPWSGGMAEATPAAAVR